VRVGGARPPPFTPSAITYKKKVMVYAPAERADTLTLILIYPYIYSVGGMTSSCNPLPTWQGAFIWILILASWIRIMRSRLNSSCDPSSRKTWMHIGCIFNILKIFSPLKTHRLKTYQHDNISTLKHIGPNNISVGWVLFEHDPDVGSPRPAALLSSFWRAALAWCAPAPSALGNAGKPSDFKGSVSQDFTDNIFWNFQENLGKQW
jgi:hypothetical protein